MVALAQYGLGPRGGLGGVEIQGEESSRLVLAFWNGGLNTTSPAIATLQ